MGDSRQSVAVLQAQLDDYRERSRKDLQDAQRNSKDRLAELQRAQSNLKAQQEEVKTQGLNANMKRITSATVQYIAKLKSEAIYIVS